jgi:chromosome segregation ATPase
MPKNSELDKIKKELKKEGSEIPDPISTPNENKEVKAEKDPGPETNPGESVKENPEEKESESGIGTKLGDIAEKLTKGVSVQALASPANPKAQAAAGVQQNPEQMKKDISEMVKKKVDSRLSDIQEDMKGLEKISNLETKINEITEKLSGQTFQPAQAQPASGGASISRELASFGEEVDFQTELYETKKTMAALAKTLDTLSKKMEYRISVLEDKSKILERMPDLEERLDDIRDKLGPENVQKLRKLIFSSDEIVDEVIPDLVNKKMRARLEPAMNEIRDMQDTINDFSSRLSHIKEEVLNLEKLRDEISELRADKEDLYKELEEGESKSNERIDILKKSIKKELENIIEGVGQELKDIRKTQSDTIQRELNNAFINLNEPRFSDLEKRLMILDEKTKRLGQIENNLEKKVASIEAPENLKKWLDTKISTLERGIIADIKSLKKDDITNASNIARLAEDLKIFQVAMKDVPNRLETQGSMINKLLDTKDYFAGRAENLAAELKGQSERLASLRASLAGLEQRLAGQDSRVSDNLGRLKDYLTSARDDLSKHINMEIESIRKTLERRSQEQTKTSLAEFKAEIKRLSATEEELKGLRKTQDLAVSRLQKQISELQEGLQGAQPELKLLGGRLSELETSNKELANTLAEASDYHKTADSVIKTELMKYIDSSIKALHRDFEARRSEDAKAQLREFKDEFSRLENLSQDLSTFKDSQEKRTDELSQALASLTGPLTDLKALVKRVDELEDINMAMDKRLDVGEDKNMGQFNALANRQALLEKSLADLKAFYKALEERVGSDNEQLRQALGSVYSDKKALNKEMASQKTKVVELIKELRSL